jgi:hypothetical protein
MFWNSISAARRNRYSGDFGEMEQHSSPQKDCAKVGEAVFANSWFGVFGDVWNILCGHPKKHYSTIEFKVIGIVYIVGVG